MNRQIALHTALLAAGIGIALAGCGKPSYPNCDNDGQCQEKGEVCVNGQCQECREDLQCIENKGENFECVGGRCDEKPECRADEDCDSVGEGLVCRSNKCVPECTETADCADGKKCEEQRCVDECSSDDECESGEACQEGACEAPQDDISDACRPAGGSSDAVSLQTVLFNFNEYDLTVEARDALRQAADCLQEAPDVTLVVEGHCDERGTQEYNLALGEKRANAVLSYLRNLGIDAGRMRSRSKGENEPVCGQATDSCYGRNRRVKFIQEQSRM